MDGSAKYTDLLLIGKTGNGKSATGNSILGRDVFPAEASSTSVTKEIQIEYSEICGRIVKVVDGPGVFDTDLSKGDALELVIKCAKYAVAASTKGYHAILLVVPYGGRFTHEDHQALEMLKGIFGLDFVKKFVILVVSRADLFKPRKHGSLQEWCSDQTGVFKSLVDECNKRVVFFDNENAPKMNEQREVLFNMVDSLSSRGERYSNEHFMRADKERERLQVESKAPIIREESLMDGSLIIQELGRIQKEEPQKRLARLEPLKKRAEKLHQGIESQDKNSGVLKDALSNAMHIRQSVDENIENAKQAIEIEAQKKQALEEIDRMRKEEDRCRQQKLDEEKRQAEKRIAELQRQNDERDARYQIMQQQMRQNNRAIQDEHHAVSQQQNSGIMSDVIDSLFSFGSLVAKAIFVHKTCAIS